MGAPTGRAGRFELAARSDARLTRTGSQARRITVRPDGNGQVVIVLPETTDCDAQGAICTEDGRMLSHRLMALPMSASARV